MTTHAVDRPALIIIGPSGAGKSTIVETLQREGLLRLVPTWTDRPRRPGEASGEHEFVSAPELDAAYAAGKFLHAPIALFGLEYRYALPHPDPPDGSVVNCMMLRAAVRPLAEKYIPQRLVYQIEAPRERVESVLQERAAKGDELGRRLHDYNIEVASGRDWADRVFVNQDLQEVLRSIRSALEADIDF